MKITADWALLILCIVFAAIIFLGFQQEYAQYSDPDEYVQCDDARPRNC